MWRKTTATNTSRCPSSSRTSKPGHVCAANHPRRIRDPDAWLIGNSPVPHATLRIDHVLDPSGPGVWKTRNRNNQSDSWNPDLARRRHDAVCSCCGQIVAAQGNPRWTGLTNAVPTSSSVQSSAFGPQVARHLFVTPRFTAVPNCNTSVPNLAMSESRRRPSAESNDARRGSVDARGDAK